MKNLFIYISFLFVGHLMWMHPTQTAKDEVYVYICTGKYSECYHATDTCKGLDPCTHTVQKITESKAIEKGRRKCRICYKEQRPKPKTTIQKRSQAYHKAY